MRMLPFIVDISIHFQDSARHVYVEVIMRGEMEGGFLEDPEAHRWETLADVSRLGGFWWWLAKRETDDPRVLEIPVYWTHADIDRRVDEITMTSHAGFSKMVTGAACLAGRATCYQHLVLARRGRDQLRDRSDGSLRRSSSSRR